MSKTRLYPLKEQTQMEEFLSQKFKFSSARHESINFDSEYTEKIVNSEYTNPLLTKILVVDEDIIFKLAQSNKATIEVFEIFIKNLLKEKINLKNLVDNFYNSYRFISKYFKLIEKVDKRFSGDLLNKNVFNNFLSSIPENISIENFIELDKKFSYFLKENYKFKEEDNELYKIVFQYILKENVYPYFENFIEMFKSDNPNFKDYNLLFTKNDIEKSKVISKYHSIIKIYYDFMFEENILFNKIDTNHMLYSIDTIDLKKRKDGNIDVNSLLESIEAKRKTYNINTILLGEVNLSDKDKKVLFNYLNDNEITTITKDMTINFQKLNKLNVFLNSLIKKKTEKKGIVLKNYFTGNTKVYSFDLLKVKDFHLSNLMKDIIKPEIRFKNRNILDQRKNKDYPNFLFLPSDKEIRDVEWYQSNPIINLNLIGLDIKSKSDLNSIGFLRKRYNSDLGFSKELPDGSIVEEKMDIFWYLFETKLESKNFQNDNQIKIHEKSKFLLVDIILKLYRNEIPFLNNPIGSEIEDYNDFSKIFFDIKELEDKIYLEDFLKMHVWFRLKGDEASVPDLEELERTQPKEKIEMYKRIAKKNMELFLFQSIKLYNSFNSKESNISTIYNLLMSNMKSFIDNFQELVNEEPEYKEISRDREKSMKKVGMSDDKIYGKSIFDFINAEEDREIIMPSSDGVKRNDKFLYKVSKHFLELFEKIDIWTNLNFQLNKLFDFASLDSDFDKMLKGEITNKDLNLTEKSFRQLISSITQIKKDVFYQQLIENNKIIALDPKSKYKGKGISVEEKKIIFKNIFDIQNYYKESESFQIGDMSHADQVLGTKGNNANYIQKMLEDDKLDFSESEIETINLISEGVDIETPGNDFIPNTIYYFNKLYVEITLKAQKGEIDFNKMSQLLDSLASDLFYSEDLFQMEKVAFSYESKIDSILDGDFIIFNEEDKKAILDFESVYISKFTDIEESDIIEFRKSIKEILVGIENKGKFYITDYSKEENFVYYGIIKLFSNHYNSTENNQILEISEQIGIIDSKIDFELLQTTIEEIIYSTEYQKNKLIELNRRKQERIITEVENDNNKKFLNYTMVSMKSIIENTFKKMGELNYFRLHKEINGSINYSKEKTLFGVFKDVLVNYLADTYNLLEDKNGPEYALLLSFKDYLNVDMLKIIKKLSEAVGKNIVVGKTDIETTRKQGIRGLTIEEIQSSEIYKVYLTRETPRNGNKYVLNVGDTNLKNDYQLNYNKEVLDMSTTRNGAKIENDIIEIDL